MNVIVQIMRGFLILVGISLIISVPLGYFVSNHWLQDFEYRIDISPIIFVAAGFISLVVASLAIISQSWSVANANPVHTLKYE